LWAARHTAPTDVLAVEAESAVYLYTGRQTVPVHTFTVQQYFNPRTAEQDAAVIDGVLASYHVSAVAVTTRTIRDAAVLLASRRPLNKMSSSSATVPPMAPATFSRSSATKAASIACTCNR